MAPDARRSAYENPRPELQADIPAQARRILDLGCSSGALGAALRRVLADAAALLAPGGTVVVSLPNVRYWETFWQLGVRGTWPRRAVGTFDRTHLRWFTLRDAHDLLTGAGCDVVAVDRLTRLGPERPPRRGGLAAHLPGRTLLTFQHVLVGRRR